MHTYASTTPEARELVAELEFVWDQVRGNTSSNGVESVGMERIRRRRREGDEDPGSGLRVLRPMSEADEDEEDDRLGNNEEREPDAQDEIHADTSVRSDELLSRLRRPSRRSPGPAPDHDADWRRRIERTLVKMTAELAALREQFESRRFFSIRGRRKGVVNWLLGFFGIVLKHVLWDAVMIGAVVLWFRWKKGGEDVRLEEWIRGWWRWCGARVEKVKGRIVRVGVRSLW